MRRVNVYLQVMDDAPPFVGGNALNLFPVSRQVNAAAPARPALEALLAGPTAEESSHGVIELSVNQLHIGSLTINHATKTATVNFVGSPSWPGDLAPGRFRKAVEKTLLQFETVDTVHVSVNGDPDFDSGEG